MIMKTMVVCGLLTITWVLFMPCKSWTENLEARNKGINAKELWWLQARLKANNLQLANNKPTYPATTQQAHPRARETNAADNKNFRQTEFSSVTKFIHPISRGTAYTSRNKKPVLPYVDERQETKSMLESRGQPSKSQKNSLEQTEETSSNQFASHEGAEKNSARAENQTTLVYNTKVFHHRYSGLSGETLPEGNLTLWLGVGLGTLLSLILAAFIWLLRTIGTSRMHGLPCYRGRRQRYHNSDKTRTDVYGDRPVYSSDSEELVSSSDEELFNISKMKAFENSLKKCSSANITSTPVKHAKALKKPHHENLTNADNKP